MPQELFFYVNSIQEYQQSTPNFLTTTAGLILGPDVEKCSTHIHVFRTKWIPTL